MKVIDEGRAGWENIWLSVMVHGPRTKYYPIRPSHLVNKYIIQWIRIKKIIYHFNHWIEIIQCG